MKKLLTLLVCFLTFLGASAVEPTQVFHENHSSRYMGINSLGQNVFVELEKIGNDARYTIYKPDFSVDKSFSIKGAYAFEGMLENEPDAMEDLSGDYGRYDRVAIQGLGSDINTWYVFVDQGYWDDNYSWKRTAYNIYDESGTLICNLMDYCGALFSIQSYVSPNGKAYIVTDNSDDEDEINIFWDFRGGSGVNAPVAVKKTSRAYPNPLHQGRQFTIEFSEAAPEGTKVVVSDMNGTTLYTTEVRAGSEKVVIPSRKLRNGNLVYSVISGGNILEKGKIIVR